MKIIEFHPIINNTMTIIEFNFRIIENHKNNGIPLEHNENHKDLIIPCENDENHENLRIPININ